ncbi:hypothetical protein D4764_22G0001980 [Takifugu flavidus]|uniref:Interleukin-17 receptor C/E N-terminal domain-containing protein n=1 Tax=Takifugu flavidus TaxID=433684 RepID=A0A5C6NDH1_9TELE|nr:hypothetical protein D4764_22G0001980 [Takifugu flavidus]
MILLAALLVSQCCVSVSAAAGGSAAALERIEDCGTGCSQGLRCRTKPQALFPPPCQDPGESLLTSSVFHNISVTTVMRCEGRQKCSLHLRVSADLRLTAAVHGVSICVAAAGMMADCRTVRFTKASRARMSGMQVKVWNDCTQVSPGQRLEIKVRTVPSYCGVTWTGAYVAPGCAAGDLQQHVPDCITGRLSYDVDADGKLLAVSVSDMLEGHDYHLRLCHKDFICTGAGAHTLIRKEEPVKKALLRFSRPLPCLCIEGWSAITDARRVQVCPFRDRVEELWSGISFDALEGGLSWEPACPVAAVVALCQMREEGGACADLPHASRNASTGKITFGEVGPHPRLCMKKSQGLTPDKHQWQEKLPFNRKKPGAGPGSCRGTLLLMGGWGREERRGEERRGEERRGEGRGGEGRERRGEGRERGGRGEERGGEGRRGEGRGGEGEERRGEGRGGEGRGGEGRERRGGEGRGGRGEERGGEERRGEGRERRGEGRGGEGEGKSISFTAASRSWIRCPFANPSFQDEELLAQPGRGHVRLLSQIDAVFSVGHCAEGEGFEDPCQTLETRTWRAGQQEALVLPLPGAVCSSCLQVKRVDVEFAVTHRFCVNQCNQTLSISAVNTPLAAPDLTCTVVPMAVSISTVILLTSLVLLTVYHRRKQKINGKYMPEQQTDSSLECVIPALQAKSECVPHSPQSEKVNLIWD